MRTESILRHLGFIFLFQSAFLLLSLLVSILYDDGAWITFAYTMMTALVFGGMFVLFTPVIESINFMEGIGIVVFGWFSTCIIGAIPYLLYGGEFTLANAWFESVSGFTTTGSTILNDIESLPPSILFFRSSTHWMGGIGIILFVLLILPQSKSKLVLLNTEISSLSQTNFKQNKQQVLKILAYVYVALTLAETLALNMAGMSLFDAINHAFATIATGGFSTRNLSIAAFDNLSIEIIIMGFMVLSGIHFGLLFGTIFWYRNNIFTSSMAKTFMGVMIIGIVIVAVSLNQDGYFGWGSAIRYASFQVISLGTTTGFATIDTANWPSLAVIILMYFTIQCGMIGSTSGGLKFDRVFLFFKILKRQILQVLHPHIVKVARIDHQRVPEDVIVQTQVFIILYILIFFITSLLLTAFNIDLLTAFSASIATIGNVGPGFAGVSSLGNFADLPDGAKVILSINMLLGRLEILNILALFTLRMK